MATLVFTAGEVGLGVDELVFVEGIYTPTQDENETAILRKRANFLNIGGYVFDLFAKIGMI